MAKHLEVFRHVGFFCALIGGVELQRSVAWRPKPIHPDQYKNNLNWESTMMKVTLNKLKVLAIAVVTLVVLIVVLQNTQDVETKLLFLTVTMPNAALLFGTLIIGFAIGVLTAGHIVAIAKRTTGSASDKESKAAA